MVDFCMPSLGADMEYGYLVEWYIKPGDTVKRGQVVADVETEKGVIEIEIWEDGTVEELLVEPSRDEVPVGSAIARIRTAEGEEVPVAAPAPAPVHAEIHPMDHHAIDGGRAPALEGLHVTPVARRVAESLDVDLGAVVGTGESGKITRHDVEQAAAHKAAPTGHRVRISPAARRLAEELRVSLDAIDGTGPDGAVTLDDVRAAAQQTPEPATKPVDKSGADFQEGMRRAIAKAMARSNREIPHYYLQSQFDMSRPLDWLEEENGRRSIQDRLLPAVLHIKAVAAALKAFPQLNGYWVDDHLESIEAVHIGFAIALRKGGLVTPAIFDADQRDMDEIMASLRDLIQRTRSGKLRGREMTDSTITLTSLGDIGVETVYGVIYPPQVALVGLGKISEMPWAENGMLGIRRVMNVTLAGDHRASDGRVGAQFLEKLKLCYQEPEKL